MASFREDLETLLFGPPARTTPKLSVNDLLELYRGGIITREEAREVVVGWGVGK